jgi:hypothetical protein
MVKRAADAIDADANPACGYWSTAKRALEAAIADVPEPVRPWIPGPFVLTNAEQDAIDVFREGNQTTSMVRLLAALDRAVATLGAANFPPPPKARTVDELIDAYNNDCTILEDARDVVMELAELARKARTVDELLASIHAEGATSKAGYDALTELAELARKGGGTK